MFEGMVMDFDDYINEQKDHILKKDCWSITDASFLLTNFEVELIINGKIDTQDRYAKELIEAGIKAKVLRPDYDGTHFKPKTIIKWAIEKGLLREGAFSSFLEKNNEKDVVVEIKESFSSNTEHDAIRKHIEMVKRDFPGVTSKQIVSHCFEGFKENTRKKTLIKQICSEVGIEKDEKSGRLSKESKDYIQSAPKF